MKLALALAALAGCDRLFAIGEIAADAPGAPMIDAPTFDIQRIGQAQATFGPGPTKRMELDVPVGAVQAGDLLVVAICFQADDGLMGVTDDHADGFYESTSQNGPNQAFLLYSLAVHGGPETVRVLFKNEGVTAADVRVVEYANLMGVDTSSGQATSSVPMPSSGPVTTTAAPSLLVAATCTNAKTLGVTGYATIETSDAGNAIAERFVGELGTYEAVASLDRPIGGIVQLAAFKGFPAQ